MVDINMKRKWHAFRKSLYDDDEWYDFLTEWCYIDNRESQFIREFAHPERRLSTTVKQMIKQMQFYCAHKRDSAYMTIYDFACMDDEHKKRKRPLYCSAFVDMMWWETDSVRRRKINGKQTEIDYGLQQSYDEIMKIYEKTRGYKSAILYSGGGFHLYNRIPEPFRDSIILLNFRQKILFGRMMTHDKMLERVYKEFPTIDPSGFGDVARVTRIPWTIHPKREIQVIPVKPGEPLVDILARASVWHKPEVILFE